MAKKRKVDGEVDEEVDMSVTEPDANGEEGNERGEAEGLEVEEEEEEEDLTKLLEPFNKEQLIELLGIAVSNDSKVLEEIYRVADLDPAHRKIFVHGLGWETTTEKLREFFSQFGELEDCNVVLDKATGKSKGYGFLLFKHRRHAQVALKEPQKKIESRMTACQLASSGPVNTVQSNSVPHTQQTQHPSHDNLPKKIYVGNVHPDVPSDKLHAFFSKYGEIEEGPLGFDKKTGKSKGFALFIYKTAEGARKALEEPNKSFDGHQLYCQKATDSHKLRSTAAAPISGGGGPAPAPGNVLGAGGFNTPANAGGGFNAQGGVGFGASGGGGFNAPDGAMAQNASAASAAQLLGQGFFGGTFPFGQGLPPNQAALAVLAAAGQNPAAFGVNPAVLASLNPAWAAAMNAAPHPVASTAQSTIPQAMPGYGMGNPGYQNPQAYQANNSYQSGPMAQPHQQRPQSAVGQMGGYGAR
ncbi:UBP1-associated protein 2A-like [Telopea speciosissima]|uniref:UBP1-associated protein 2A-like n=1 Tax=Telopea speciosissima TaxID=54955 RepID=UPI001CC687DC|nr:UBP1-associated protein 2A-like [Telopea speciosissima]XP_043698111.1 UBP1-associated protein 2A-like [Telopea speciosissima]